MVMLISSSISMTSVEVRGVQRGGWGWGWGWGVGLVLGGFVGVSLFCSLASKAYRRAADTSWSLYYLHLHGVYIIHYLNTYRSLGVGSAKK
jgi:hypothetical protein